MTNFAEWSGYAQLTPDAPAASVTDFTFFLDLSILPSAWWDAVADDGADIRVTNVSHGELAFDLIEYDHANETGLLAFRWSGTYSGEPVRVWAGNSSASAYAVTDDYGQYNTYDDNWVVFYPFGGGSDRTQNAADLTMVGAPTVGGAVGPLGNTATDYNGTTQYGSLSTAVVAADYPITFLAWANTDSSTAEQCVCALNYTNDGNTDSTASTLILSFRGDQGGDPVIAQALDTSANGNQAAFVNGYDVGAWHHVAGRFSAEDDRLCWKDGSNTGTKTQTRSINSPLDLLGVGAQLQFSTTHALFNGKLSLVQVHDTARADAWVQYQASLRNQSAFWNTPVWTDYITDEACRSEWRLPSRAKHQQPAWLESFFAPGDPILNDDVPFFDSRWTMVGADYRVNLFHSTLPVPLAEIPEFVHLDNEWRMPQFPRLLWRPLIEPSYYSDDQEAPHPEVDRIDLPIWLPWRPIPEFENFFSDEAENILPDFYESASRFELPIRPKPWVELVFEPMDDEPLPEIGFDFIPSMEGVPAGRPYFMPDFPSYYNQEVRPEKCPPPCLRRPEKRC